MCIRDRRNNDKEPLFLGAQLFVLENQVVRCQDRTGDRQLATVLLYNLPVPVLHNLRVTLEMIKWEHSIFALPFALCGACLLYTSRCV